MPGARPQDVYDPNQTVAPTTGAPQDYLTTKASPEAYGANVGEATQKLGATGEQLGTGAVDVAIQQQGLLNEHMANQSELQLAVQGGKVYDQYKSLEGMDAAAAKDSYVNQYLAVNQKIRDSLPNAAAQRAYDQLATRRMSYVIQDMNSYSATETKKAYQTGNSASMNLSIDRASSIDVATNPGQFGFELGNVIHQANAMFTAPEYGKYRDIAATQNKDGTISFDQKTQEGQIAQADYDNYVADAKGKIWYNRIEALLKDPQKGNPIVASDTFEANKKDIPPKYQAQIMNMLVGPVRTAQTKTFADRGIANADADYSNDLAKAVTGKFNPAQFTQNIIQQESGGKGLNLGQIQPNTWNQFARPGEDINNAKDNAAVTQRIITKYYNDYKGDPERMAVAYFSGPGNVAPIGSPTPYKTDSADKNGKHVSEYVNDMVGRLVGSSSATGYQSRADYYRTHYGDIVESNRDSYLQAHPGDIPGADMVASQTEQHISNVIHTQELSDRADSDLILNAVLGNLPDQKGQPITSVAGLDNAPPNIKDAWTRMQGSNAYAANLVINKILSANSRGSAQGFGTEFYDRYADVMSGKITDPIQLINYVGSDKNAPLTNTGVKALYKELQQRNTPEGQAFAGAELKFMSQLHDEATGKQLFGITDSRLEESFQQNMMQILPQIEAGRANNKSANDLFDPKSKDYVGKSFKPPNLADLMHANIRNLLMDVGSTQKMTIDPATVTQDQLRAARQSGQINDQQLNLILMDRGWLKPQQQTDQTPQVPTEQ